MTQCLPNNAKWKTWIKWLFCFKNFFFLIFFKISSICNRLAYQKRWTA